MVGGGFSLGFHQQGFKAIRGIDSWSPAIKTHNLNFGLNDTPKDVLDFQNLKEIEELEDSHIIIGSPPCVSFSLSNKSGGADKSLGIQLIETGYIGSDTRCMKKESEFYNKMQELKEKYETCKFWESEE